ncbi:MAG: hypothetical protein ABIR33_02260 [Pyrinomonadaceae bacterium]
MAKIGDKWKPAKYVFLLGVRVFSEDLSVVWVGSNVKFVFAYTQILATLPVFGKIFFRQVKVTGKLIKD